MGINTPFSYKKLWKFYIISFFIKAYISFIYLIKSSLVYFYSAVLLYLLSLQYAMRCNKNLFKCKGTFSPLLGYIPGALRGCQGQPSARPQPPLICSSGLQPPSSPIGSSLVMEAIAYLITISSSSIDSLVTYARLACSLLYTWAILPHTTRFKNKYIKSQEISLLN